MKYTTKHIDNYVVIVSDEKPKNEEWGYDTFTGEVSKRRTGQYQFKVIAINPGFKDIPVFDIPVEWGVDVEWLAQQEADKQDWNFEGGKENYNDFIEGFEAGYNKRAETHLFTMEDIKGAMGKSYGTGLKGVHLSEAMDDADKFIQSLLKPQEYQVEIEMEEKEYQVQFTDGAWSRTIATRLIPKIINGKIKIIKWQKI